MMFHALGAISDMSTGDMSDFIVENAAAEIAATSPTPATPATSAPATSNMIVNTLLLAAVSVGLYYYTRKHRMKMPAISSFGGLT